MLGSYLKSLHISHHVVFWEHKMFFSFSKFHISEDSYLPFFTHSTIDLFPPTTEITPLVEPTIPTPVSYKHVPDPNTPRKPSMSDNSSSIELPTTAIPNENASSIDHVNKTTIPPPTRQSTPVKELPRCVCDYHCYSTIFSHHEHSSHKQ